MKQFNLNEYLKDPSKKVVTRDGRSARIICTDRIYNQVYPIIGLVSCKNENDNIYESIYAYTINGEVNKNEICKSDLFFAPEKKEGWISIYKTESGSIITDGYVDPSKTLAKFREAPCEYPNATLIDTIKIEWEE